MEDLKRLVFPAIVALVLHGFLVSFQLPKQQTVKPFLTGNSIKVEINTFSPKATVLKKKEEEAKTEEIIPEPIFKKTKPEQTKVITKPIVIAKKQKKLKIEPEQKEKKEVVEDKKRQSQTQSKKDVEKVSEVLIEKVSETEASAVESSVNLKNEFKNDLPTRQNTLAPLQKKALPIYRQNKQPPYPVMARRRGYEGEILLTVLVDPEGMVSEITIKRSSGHLSLDRAARKAVKKWLFTPAMEGSRPVSMWVDVPIDFQLN